MNSVDSIYFHFPYCKHLCNYCDFFKYKLKNADQITNYHRYLEMSWPVQLELLNGYDYQFAPKMQTLYWGGGTPSLWGKRGAEFFREFYSQYFQLAQGAEFTVELDPGAWDEQGFDAFLSIGVNRFSVGIQCLDPDILPFVDRSHTYQESLETLQMMQRWGGNFSVDLMLGLAHPAQLTRNLKKELDQILSFDPQHISLYILSTRKNYPLYDLLPVDEYSAEEYLQVHQQLEKAGFVHYEVSNYARPGYQSVHNKKYWQQKAVAAFGPTASGFLPLASGGGLRYQWKVSAAEIKEELLDSEQMKLESLYLTLRQAEKFNPRQIAYLRENEHIFAGWIEAGHVKKEGNLYQMSPEGWLVMDSLVGQVL